MRRTLVRARATMMNDLFLSGSCLHIFDRLSSAFCQVSGFMNLVFPADVHSQEKHGEVPLLLLALHRAEIGKW
jgi:hypothetical protein